MTRNDWILLKEGHPPESGDVLERLTLSNPWLSTMDEYCLEHVIANGGCKVKILHGEPKTGKSHYLRYLEKKADERGFFAVRLDVSSIEFRITDVAMLYRATVARLDYESFREKIAILLAHRLGLTPRQYTNREVPLFLLIADLENASEYEARQTIRKTINTMTRDLDIGYSFRLFLTRFLDAISEDNEANLAILRKWLFGEKLDSAEKRQCQLFEGLTKGNARVWLYSFTEILKMAGYKGTVLMLDTFEAILPEFPSLINYTPAKRNDVYEMLRQMIDDTDFLRNFLLLVAGNSAIVENERHGFESYHALWMRIQQNYVSEKWTNPHADLIDTTAIMKTLAGTGQLSLLAQRIESLCLEACLPYIDLTDTPNSEVTTFHTAIQTNIMKYRIEA